MGEHNAAATDKPEGDGGGHGQQSSTGGGLQDQLGPMLKEAEEKGVKGAFLSRLKKAKIGKVNLDPEIDEMKVDDQPPALKSRATMDEEGMINVWVDLQKHLANLPHPSTQEATGRETGVDVEGFDQCPPLNIVIFIVGSRGDVQPYLSLALRLILSHSHRVRIATHPDFKDFVLEANKRLIDKKGKNGQKLEGLVEFFDIGGSPKELMSYMVKNPGLLPAWESLKNGDVGAKRKMTAAMLEGFWESTFAPDPVSGKPFAVDAIISNPPAFGHVHIAEALGVPLMMSFTMPWTPSTSFKHPLVNIKETNAEKSMTNYLSYDMANLLQWQGLGDIINAFRSVTLGLEPLTQRSGPYIVDRLRIPYTYCWSEGLIQKPPDWGNHVEISGFYFLEAETDFKPQQELVDFLKAGEAPIYIGFGSVVVSDAEAMTKTIMDAVKAAGVRALVSAGWGGLGGADVPEEVFILKGNIPHDWLFADGRVKAVCHHGGAGTTAIGLRNGLPTIVVPFFGDQKFWGDMIHRAGAGPAPIPQKQLTVENLADAFKYAVSDDASKAAKQMGEQIRAENGEEKGVSSFHRHLPLRNMRCDVDPERSAIWKSKQYYVKLSGAVAGLLETEGKLKMADLQPLRSKEYQSRSTVTDNVGFPGLGENFSGVQQMMFDTKRGTILSATAIPQGTFDHLMGLHSAISAIPKLLGSDVREKKPVNDLSSGVREASKGLFYGYWDGITGLATEPYKGAQREGAIGFLKGAGRSWVNVVARPAGGITGALALPLYGGWKGLRRTWAGRPDLALRHPREESSRNDAKELTDEEKSKILQRFDELSKDVNERKNRRQQAQSRARERLEEESVERDRYGTAEEGDQAAKKPVPKKRRDSDAVSIAGSDILWDDESPAGPGGLTDEERKEVDAGQEEGVKDVEQAKDDKEGAAKYLASAVSTLVKGKIASVATRHNQQHQHAFWTFPSSDFITLSQALDVGASTSDQADKGLSECRSGKGAKMRIEELILDGFKSYPVRTTISGFDESFNAITGLNGSGKSNILDAICFVLGITNMQSVRANNLMDLIYKRGQAGVTKASVTIVFNNQDRSKAPVGFENTPQITVTRQIAVGNISKYLLNGHKSTLQALQNLFQSVQLNINNPNFLIMQGKITKVLNMKAPEILGMVEEAAGTRMFEERKDKAMKTMTKKDKKVEEIETLLREEIDPKLEKLRAEKRSYLEFQKASSELERLTRLVKAYEWTDVVDRLDKAKESLAGRQTQIDRLRADITQGGKQREDMEAEVKAIQKRREQEMAKGGKIQALTDAVTKLDNELAKVKTQIENTTSTLADDGKRVDEAKTSVKDLNKSLQTTRASSSKNADSFGSLKSAYDEATAELAKREELLQTLLTGLSSSSADDEGAGGYMGQLAEAKARLAAAGTEAEQAKVKITMAEKEIKEKEPRVKKAEKEGEGLIKELAAKRAEVEKLQGKLSGAGWDEDKERDLLQKQSTHSQKMNELMERRDQLKSRLSAIDFSYSDPEPRFDRSKVKGLVATLIDLDSSNYKSSTALEICAGGKLYNVVVEDERVGSQLLEKGRLKKRVTIIPLNKINAFKLSADKLSAAKRIAPGKVDLALDLVGSAREVSAAMAYVFGDTFICADKQAAQAVTFNREIGVKSVTLEGDVYDPLGTLSGGAAPNSSGILVKVQELKEVEVEIQKHKAIVDEVTHELTTAKRAIDAFRKDKRDLDLRSHEVRLLEEQVGGSNSTKIIAEVDAAKKSLAEYKEVINAAKEKQKAASADCKRLEKEMDDFKNNKDSKLKEIKADIASKKKELAKQTLQVKTRQKEVQTAELEIQQFETDLEAAEQEIVDATAAQDKTKAELATLQDNYKIQQNDYRAAEAKLKDEQAALRSFDNELADLEKDLKAKKKEIDEAELALKKAEHDITVATEKKSHLELFKVDLEKQFTWIVEEHQFFGKSGSPYDFDGVDLKQAKVQCRELEDKQKGMGRKVNTKVMNMIDNVEKKEKENKKSLATVLKDKAMINDTIVELDRYKRDALVKTWEKVNADFGLIFAELLPGNFAKLVPPPGKDLTDGLDVKVQLGSIWKESLTELSGGQRSLIALSLIMSLLQFKPAPMYILDEIDAALDLQHTQHIGQLFKNRFKGSQFIVVSLKEGLFTNANVLFKARFRDGTSIVERTERRSTSALYQGEDRENAAEARGGKKKGSAAGGRAPLAVR